MKIVHVIDYFQPKIGYQEYFLAKEHGKMGHNVRVITGDYFFPFSHYESIFRPVLGKRKQPLGVKTEEDVEVQRLPLVEIIPGKVVILRDLYGALERFNPDAVFCHGVYSITSYQVAQIKWKLSYKLIFDTHAAYFNTNFTDSFGKKIYHYIYKTLIQQKILRSADSIFAIGDEEQDFLCKDFQIQKALVPIIRLGVNTNRFSFSVKKRNEGRKKLHIKDHEIVIIFAGKIEKRKDVHILVEALSRLSRSDIKLILIGGGDKEYISTFKDLLPNETLLRIPFVENEDLSLYYSLSDIGVWPGDPTITLLEALSCRLPVVLPESKGTKYLDKSNGVIRFNRGNVRDLLSNLKILIDNGKLRKSFGLNAEKYIIKNLSWEHITKQTLKLIN